MGPTPLLGRQITPDHARAIAETGGSIGIWHFFPSLDKYVEGLKEMADVVGVDHVSIGTDQHVTPGICLRRVAWLQLRARWKGLTGTAPAGRRGWRAHRAAALAHERFGRRSETPERSWVAGIAESELDSLRPRPDIFARIERAAGLPKPAEP